MDANSCIRKWLWLPQCLSAAGLNGWNSPHLPLKSITLGYRQERARPVMALRDTHVRSATGKKWRAEKEVQMEMSRLQRQEVVSRAQTGQAGLGWVHPASLCSRANKKEKTHHVALRLWEWFRSITEFRLWHRGSSGAERCGRVPRVESSSGQTFWKLPQAQTLLSHQGNLGHPTLPSQPPPRAFNRASLWRLWDHYHRLLNCTDTGSVQVVTWPSAQDAGRDDGEKRITRQSAKHRWAVLTL